MTPTTDKHGPEERLTTHVTIGAIAGVLATVPMSAFLLAGQRLLPPDQQYPLPPAEIASELVQKVQEAAVPEQTPHREPDPNSVPLVALTWAGHVAYGATMGALYGALPQRGEPLVRGTLWGLAVWTGSYLGWIPRAHLLRSATDHPRERNLLMITSNALWGAATAVIAESLLARQNKTTR